MKGKNLIWSARNEVVVWNDNNSLKLIFLGPIGKNTQLRWKPELHVQDKVLDNLLFIVL